MTIAELTAEIRCRAEFNRLVELATDAADRIDYLGWIAGQDAPTARRLFWGVVVEFSRTIGVPHGTILWDLDRVYENF